jgi:hypothetical protein
MVFCVHGGHFGHGEGHCGRSKGDENASVGHGRRSAIEQCELESDGERFPRAEHDDAEVDYGRQVDVSLRIAQSVSSSSPQFKLEGAPRMYPCLEPRLEAYDCRSLEAQRRGSQPHRPPWCMGRL